jgi:hypothetical protein
LLDFGAMEFVWFGACLLCERLYAKMLAKIANAAMLLPQRLISNLL